MYGAIIGDMAGSIYEYDQLDNIHSITMGKIIEDRAFYSDDTILTMAITEAIMNNGDYEFYLRKYIKENLNYKPKFKPYFKEPFSNNMMRWINTFGNGESYGTGALMRISPVGYLFDKEKDIIKNARLATIPTHNTFEAINAATTVALIIFYLRNGASLTYVYKKLNLRIKYNRFYEFNTSCDETLNNCLYILYHTGSFEEAIRMTLLMGGDTDTNCAIVGSMAEALYGVDQSLVDKVDERIPVKYVKLLKDTQYR